MQYQEVTGGVCAPKALRRRASTAASAPNHSKYDLALIKADVRCAAAGVYTTNKVCGAPIKVDRAHLADGYAQAILVNSGNANTCAANGVDLAEECCRLTGQALGIPAEDVLPSSTGVIGQPMTIDPLPRASRQRPPTGPQRRGQRRRRHRHHDHRHPPQGVRHPVPAGRRHLHRGRHRQGQRDDRPQHGHHAGFLHHRRRRQPAMLQKALREVVPGTYNQMSVDLDTSTNDTLLILASGLAGNAPIEAEGPDYNAFVAALTAIAEHMCAEHAGDGEGATHLITCEVTGAPDLKTARAVSRSVVCSNLFKAAVFGGTLTGAASLRHRLHARGFFHRQGLRLAVQRGGRSVRLRERRLPPLQRGGGRQSPGRARHLVRVDMGLGSASAKAGAAI